MQSVDIHKWVIFEAIESWVENQELCRKEEGNDSPIILPDVTSTFKCWIESDFHEFLEAYAWNLEQFEDYAFDFTTFTTEFSQSVFLSIIENLSLSDIVSNTVTCPTEKVISEKLSILNDWVENSYLNEREFLQGSELEDFDKSFDVATTIDNVSKKLACAVLDNDQTLIQIYKKQLEQLL